MMVYIIRLIVPSVKTFFEFFLLMREILICRIHQLPIWRYGSTLSGTLSLLFSPSGTKALMRQFVANAPKAHESLSTEARRVPVQGTPIPLISVFIAIFRLDTIWRYSHSLLYTNKSELGTSIIPSDCC